MDARSVVRALKTPVTMLLLLALVYFAARWGLENVTKPIPPRPPDPCVMKKVGPELTPPHVVVSVYNGTDVNGLGKRVRSNLLADGFNVVKVGNTPEPTAVKTEIVGVKVDSPEVLLVRAAFKDAVIRADGRVDHSVDVIIGKEFAGYAENPVLKIPVASGEVCLPQHTAVTTPE